MNGKNSVIAGSDRLFENCGLGLENGNDIWLKNEAFSCLKTRTISVDCVTVWWQRIFLFPDFFITGKLDVFI